MSTLHVGCVVVVKYCHHELDVAECLLCMCRLVAATAVKPPVHANWFCEPVYLLPVSCVLTANELMWFRLPTWLLMALRLASATTIPSVLNTDPTMARALLAGNTGSSMVH